MVFGLFADRGDHLRSDRGLVVVREVELLVACPQVYVDVGQLLYNSLGLLLFVCEHGQLLFFGLCELSRLDMRRQLLGHFFCRFDLAKSLVMQVLILHDFPRIRFEYLGCGGYVLGHFLRDLIAVYTGVDEVFNWLESKGVVVLSLLTFEIHEKRLPELIAFAMLHLAQNVVGDFPVVRMEAADEPAPELVEPHFQMQVAYQVLYLGVLH